MCSKGSMNYDIIESFLKNNFPSIDGVILFGSYIDNPLVANDIDLLLVSEKFSYSSKESFFYAGIKINTVKFNPGDIFGILAKHYQQGDFYKLVFENGIIIRDIKRDIYFVRSYIKNNYPSADADIIAFGLNETLFKLAEYIETLKKPLSNVEFYCITAKITTYLIDWFLFNNSIHNLKSDKFKSRFFNKNFPIETARINLLITASRNNNAKKYLKSLTEVLKEYSIPVRDKYSSDLIYDDYTQNQLILYIEHLFSFLEIKAILQKIHRLDNSIKFFIYQVDKDQQEKMGCYIVFDNLDRKIDLNKGKWLDLFRKLFQKYQYTFPYNNIYCYPEIKFSGKKNQEEVYSLLSSFTDIVSKKNHQREVIVASLIENYLLDNRIHIHKLYEYYLFKLSSKMRSSNFYTDKTDQTENKLLEANIENINLLSTALKNCERIELINFNAFSEVQIWFHFQLIDMLLSILVKGDFEKLFYIHCIKKINA